MSRNFNKMHTSNLQCLLINKGGIFMQKIRDKVLSLLSHNFSSEQLKMIDLAVAEALKGKKIEEEETLPAVINGGIPEVMEYLARKKSKGLTMGTIEQYRQVLTAFMRATQKKLDDIKDWDIIRFLDQYESYRGVGKRRKDSMRVILNGFFRYMTDCGRLKANPMATIEAIKFKKKVRQPLSDIEFERLRRACITPKERALVEFLFATGCRVSEVVNVNRSDIDYFEQTLKVTGKGNKERFVYINAAAVVALDEYFVSRTDSEEALFVSDRKPNQRLKKNAIEKIIRQIGERASINRRVFPHLLRHTAATHLHQHGMPLEELQKILGHESADTTRIYAKDDPAMIHNSYRRAS